MNPIRVGIIDEEEIFRRGLAASLAEHEAIDIVFAVAAVAAVPPEEPVAVIVSSSTTHGAQPDCATVVCGNLPDTREGDQAEGVLGYLPRETLTKAQLIAAVQAAAVGLRVGPPFEAARPERRFDRRRRDVLRLLAEGADTRAISRALRYSERTVKALIQNIEHELNARNRAHAVALAIREGLI